MGHSNLITGNKLRDKKTGAELMTFDNKENKYFAAVVMCGHCGRAYFVPVLFGFWNKNAEEVKEVAKVTPRTKRDYKEFILCMAEIDETQYKLIEYINDKDKYLIPSENGYIDDDSIERRIIMPTVLNEYFNEERKYHTRRSIQKLYSDVKIAEDYPEHLVLQKAFAPRLKKVVKEKIVENGKTVEIEKPIYEYPKKVKIEDFIDDYFTAEVFKHGIIGRKITMIAMYYYLYGENNPLGIRYKDGVVSFINHKGEAKFYEVHDSVKEYLDSENVGYKNKYKNFGGYEEILKIAGNEKHKVSRIEKFQDRFKRSQEIQNQNKKQIQPGEE